MVDKSLERGSLREAGLVTSSDEGWHTQKS